MRVWNHFMQWLAAIVLAAGCAGGALAAPITYTITGTGTGTAGGTAFTNAAYTITLVADTGAFVVPVGYRYVPTSSATMAIQGLGTATITLPTRLFVNGNIAGWSRAGAGGSDLLNMPAPEFSSWLGDTDLGPLTNITPLALHQFNGVTSSLGNITMPTSSVVSFQARLGSVVVEPTAPMAVPFLSGANLLVLAVLMTMAVGWTRHRQRRP